jgi:hypothetical protein
VGLVNIPKRAVLPAFVVGLLAISITAVAAYEDTGFDPDDRAIVGSDPDVHRTTRRVFSTSHGRMLSISVRAYEEFGLYWGLRIPLDSRGGPHSDYVMRLFNADQSGAGCSISGQGEGRSTGGFRQDGFVAACRVPARLAHPNKGIRWKIISESGYNEPQGETERAPNRGWYGYSRLASSM